MSVSLSRGFYPHHHLHHHQHHPHPSAYLDLLHPLRSLGRLVSESPPVSLLPPPGPLPGAPTPLLGPLLAGSGLSYLGTALQAQPLLSSVAEEQGAGPLSSDFGSPSSSSSSTSSSSSPSTSACSPPKDGVCRRSRTCYNFSEDDLFMVLYGYCGSQDRNHAISGVALPEKTVPDCHILSLDKEALELPEGLIILQSTWGNVSHRGVFTDRSCIPKGRRFGPFQGKLVNTSEIKTYDDNTLMWEVFENGRLSHFVDGRGGAGNWMSLVKCARFPDEQNLVAVQVQGQIFYEACKDIRPGQELLVWYGDCYMQFLGIPLTLKDPSEDHTVAPPAEDAGEGFKCDRCGKVFAYKYYRDKHLKYTRCVDQGDRKFPCHLCNRSFEKRDRLRIHILHVHEKHRPHKCSVCGKSFSQSSSLNKHMRVHSGERPYKCVYCNKAFTASSILRTHIRQHSGERPFKCKHCGKAFASHAAHDSHVRRTHARDKPFPCDLCGASFQEELELQYHMRSHKKILDSAVLPACLESGSQKDAVFPATDNPKTQKDGGQNFPYTGLTVVNPEYRPWN